MPSVCQFNGMSIYIYYGDHEPPHFHARAAGNEARIKIGNGEAMTSSLSASQLREVLAWAQVRRAELQAAWHDAQRGVKPLQIPPP